MSWIGLVAEFANDSAPPAKRGAPRRRLRFESVLTSSRPRAKVVVLDLSEDGLMILSNDALTVGETFEVWLPEERYVEARVIWKRVSLYGCEFLSPLSTGTISAVLLQAAPRRRVGSGR